MGQAAIGVFDSGVGGLTVYSAMRDLMPCENYIYVGDTARVPYGTKPPQTVERYCLEIADMLVQKNVKMLVVACNTATAHGLKAIRRYWPDLPCVGVISPGAQAAAAKSRNKRIVVWATEGTIRSKAYEVALKEILPTAHVEGMGCNVLVSLAEEGWDETEAADAAIQRYLNSIKTEDYDTLVLGCTHFPILSKNIQKRMPIGVSLVDSAQMTAITARKALLDKKLISTSKDAGQSTFYATDGLERFRSLMGRFCSASKEFSVELASL